MKSSRIVTELVAILAISALLFGCYGGDTSIPPTATTVTSEPVIGTIYSLSYRYEEGKFSLIAVHVESGSAPYRREPAQAGYKYEVLSFGDEVLGSFGFVLPLLHYDYPDPQTGQLQGGIVQQKTMNGTILIPYFINAATINLYDPNGARVLSVNVRNLAIKLTLQADVWTDKGGKGYGVPGGVYDIGKPIFSISVNEDSRVWYTISNPDGKVLLSYGPMIWSAGTHLLPGISGTPYHDVPSGNWKIYLTVRTDKETAEDSCQFEVMPLSETVNPVTTYPQSELTSVVASIIADPKSYEGQRVNMVGYFRGWDLLHEASGGPPVTRSDWVIKDASGAIYVSGWSKAGMPRDPSSLDNVNTILALAGVIRVTAKGQPYIEAESIEIL